MALSCTPVRARVAETGHLEEDKAALPCAPDAPNWKGSRVPPRSRTQIRVPGTESRPIHDVCEVFSPPRICAAAREQGLKGGWSVDLTIRDPGTGRSFDLRNPKDQKEVKRMIRRDRPTVLIVSPPCTAFSIANQGEVDPATLAGAVEMIRFPMDICDLQRKAGRHFVFEQPQSSRAWQLDEVVQMAYRAGVNKSSFHQCMYALSERPPWFRPCLQTYFCPYESSRFRGSSPGQVQRRTSPRSTRW